MGCCASRTGTAVVASDDAPHKAKNGYHITENTGPTSNERSGSQDLTSGTNRVSTGGGAQNPNFTIAPKYTTGLNTAVPSNNHNSGDYRNTNDRERMSVDFLTPGQTTDVLSLTYANTDPLRASPYLSGIGNRKQYDRTKLEEEAFRGFDAPVTNTDSEGGFDSDIEGDEKYVKKSVVRPPSPAEISLTSLLDREDRKDDTGKTEVEKQLSISVVGRDKNNDRAETVELREKLDGGARESAASAKNLMPRAVEMQSSFVPEATERLGTPSTKPVNTLLNSPRSQRRSPVVSRSGSPRPRSAPDPIMETLEDAFYRFARYGEVNSEGREMNNKNWAKLCRDCDFVDNKSILTGDVDVIFSRHKPKGQRLISFYMFVKCLEEIADRKHRSITDKKQRRNKVFEKVIGKAPEYVGITGISKSGNVERMTDHSLYPATHKMRFDEEGRGLGVDEILSYDPTEHGYVQGYRDKDTYDLKVSRPSSRTSIRPVSRETSNVSRSSPKPIRREAL